MLKEKLVEHFKAAPSTPFLFVGSGFSRRYLGLEDWEALLRRFSDGLKDFEYYRSTAGGDLSVVASLMAVDFHDLWWSHEKYAESREKHKTKVKDKSSALRIEICNYLNSIAAIDISKSDQKEELELLSQLNVDGIITTNWDSLLETLFPGYRVFVGQSELLFSNPQSIAEIYKIHGSCSKASSLILTKDDYDDFDEKNPYLAAKLITLFVEHPIVFIGYSLSDKNICQLLKSIVSVLGKENIEKLRNNLIFLQRTEKDDVAEISHTLLTIDGGQIPITIVTSKSFLPVYQALDEVKRKIPARVLRHCKEQLYELVKSTTPEAKLCVIDIDDIESAGDIEFVVGVGVASERAGLIGYQAISLIDIFEDSLETEDKFDPAMIIDHTIPQLGKTARYIPVFKHLKSLGIATLSKYLESGLNLNKHIFKDASFYRSKLYARAFVRTEKGKGTKEIIDTNPPEKAAAFLAFLPREKFDVALVIEFLRLNKDRFDTSKSSYSTYFRKLACLCDWYSHGWEPSSSVSIDLPAANDAAELA